MSFNGHKNWNYWNVALWLFNDEGLYRMVQGYVKTSKTKDEAAKYILGYLNRSGVEKTPDGAPYTVSAIRAAIRDL